jgi:hypothetical protein
MRWICAARSADWQSAVSQVGTLHELQSSRTRWLRPTLCRLPVGDTADYQSALRFRNERPAWESVLPEWRVVRNQQ